MSRAAHAPGQGPESFVAVDWGTSGFRLWHLCARGEVLQRASGPFGMSTLPPSAFGPLLEQQLDAAGVGPAVPVVICGMAGARTGWHEAPYMNIDEPLSRLGTRAVRVPDIEREVHILPGMKQGKPADVMRGEETQLLGLMAMRPNCTGTVCLPGTHSKWVALRDGRIERFTTCMTGELFGLLSERSTLSPAVTGGARDPAAFDAAVHEAMRAPERVASALFELRARSLLTDRSAGSRRSRLSGLLIGLELAATRSFRQGGTVLLLGTDSLMAVYARALASLSIESETPDAERLTRLGLTAAFARIRERTDGT